MRYAMLGNTGLVVSKLAFGGGSLGVGETLPGLRKNIGQDTADLLVDRAIDQGITLFDTADIYTAGQAETILGKALGKKRGKIVLSTKGGVRTGPELTSAGLSFRYIIQAVEASLKRLGTDWIDLYQPHTIDPLTPIEETARAFEYLITKGMVRYIGLSNWPAWMTARLLGVQERKGYAPIVSTQLYYSLVGRDIEHELAPLARATGLGVLVWSPLAGGFLTGKYTRENPNPPGAKRTAFAVPPVDLDRGYGVVDLLNEMASGYGVTPGQLALDWIIQKPWITSAIFGLSRPEQLDENLGAADALLSAADVKRLDDLTAPATQFPGWMVITTPDVKVKAALLDGTR